MRVCMPASDDRGLDSEICDHFGSAPFHVVTDTESGELEILANRGHGHGDGGCGAAARERSRNVDQVVCSDMGRNAIASLEEAGIPVFRTRGVTIREALAEIRAGTIRRLTPEAACGHHWRRHRCHE